MSENLEPAALSALKIIKAHESRLNTEQYGARINAFNVRMQEFFESIFDNLRLDTHFELVESLPDLATPSEIPSPNTIRINVY